MKKASSADVRALFLSHGLRFTRQRAALYTTLANTASHPTAEELFEMARNASAGVHGAAALTRSLSLSTVYSTLDTLVERGLCRRVACPGGLGASGARGAGPCRFDADVSEHVHVIMPDGSVRDVPEMIAARVLAGLFGAGRDSTESSDPRDPELSPNSGRGDLADVERAMGVRIGRVNLQLIAEA